MQDQFWHSLFDMLLLLLAAAFLGAIFERLKQSALVGYLLAGTLLGPVFGIVADGDRVEIVAELGVALLLFSIGLEFNLTRLKQMGLRPLVIGALQIVGTLLVAGLVAKFVGRTTAAAVAIGCMVAMSSTACVLRTLVDRSELESMHGRGALAVLLVQDIAVVPLVLLVEALTTGGSIGNMAASVGKEVLVVLMFFLLFYGVVNVILPRILRQRELSRNRELPIIMAVITGLGSAWMAHQIGISPALGAFIAGILLGESAIATQVRADVGPLKAPLVTLFFSSIGMLAQPAWLQDWRNVVLVIVVTLGVIVVKTSVIWCVARLMGLAHRHAIAMGLCLAQIGEFSFVLAKAAQSGTSIIDDDTFVLMVTVTIVTLFLTPYLATIAPEVGSLVERKLRARGLIRRPELPTPAGDEPLENHVVVIGYGPTGRVVVESLLRTGTKVVVIDLNPRSIFEARRDGAIAYIGDASTHELLEIASIETARALVVTLPDLRAASQVVRQTRAISPHLHIIARARYQAYMTELTASGAEVVIDEEQSVGRRLAIELRKVL